MKTVLVTAMPTHINELTHKLQNWWHFHAWFLYWFFNIAFIDHFGLSIFLFLIRFSEFRNLRFLLGWTWSRLLEYYGVHQNRILNEVKRCT